MSVSVNTETATNNTMAITPIDVRFHNDTVPAFVGSNGEVYAVARQVLRNIGFDEERCKSIRRKWSEDLVISERGANFPLVTKTRGVQETYCFPHKILPLALAKISITPTLKKDRPEVVDKLVKYQLECADVLYQHFFPTMKKETEIPSREVPLSREELVMILHNLVNGANDYMTTFSNNLITAVNKTIDNRLGIIDESNKVVLRTNEYLTKSHEDIMKLWQSSKYKTAKLETLLSDLVVKLDNNYTVSSVATADTINNVVTEKSEGPQINPNLVNTLSAYKTKKWMDDAWDYARIISQINGKDDVSVLKEVYKILRREGFNLNRLNTEYAKTHPGKSSYIGMIADSDVMRPKAEAAFKELYVKYTPNLNSVATEKVENSEDKIKSDGQKPEKKIYKSQVLLSTPAEVRTLIDIISAKRNCAPHQTAANVYREIEKRTNKNLKELANQYAEKLGYTNCSKAYYISKNKALMEILKELAA